MTVAEFIAARLDDEDERFRDDPGWADSDGYCYECGTNWRQLRRQVTAMRAILALHAPELRQLNNPFAGTTRVEYEANCPVCECEWPCPEVRIVAAIWSDHPDYDPESRTL